MRASLRILISILSIMTLSRFDVIPSSIMTFFQLNICKKSSTWVETSLKQGVFHIKEYFSPLFTHQKMVWDAPDD